MDLVELWQGLFLRPSAMSFVEIWSCLARSGDNLGKGKGRLHSSKQGCSD